VCHVRGPAEQIGGLNRLPAEREFSPFYAVEVQRSYTYGLQRISESQVINGAWTVSFYGYDGAGSVRQLTNSAGVVTDEYEYDAYGNSFTKQGTTPNNYLYRGEQFDSDLSLYYLRARYYNPATGRFLSRDPENGHIKDPASLHKYLYGSGDPVNRVDPVGREELAEAAVELAVHSAETVHFASEINTCTGQAFQAIGSLLSALPEESAASEADQNAGISLGECVLSAIKGLMSPGGVPIF